MTAQTIEKEQLDLSKRVEDALKLTEQMTAMELSNYAKAMREKFGITALPVAVAAGPGGGGAAGGAAAEEPTVFDAGDHELGAEGSQGPGRISAEAGQGRHQEG